MAVASPRWTQLYTRNLSPRRSKIELIVLHHTGGHEAGDLPTLLGLTKRKVSADFYITRKGKIYKLNPQLTTYCTWHAGLSRWRGRGGVNDRSIGIEMEHVPGQDWTDAQVQAAAHLCAWLCERYGIRDVVGHRDVAFPPGRKTDPENFPWDRFRELVQCASST